MITNNKEAFQAAKAVHFVGIAVCAGMVSVAAAMVVWPGVRAKDESQSQVDHYESLQQELEGRVKANRAIREQLEQLGLSVDSRRVQLSPASDLNRVLAELTAECLEGDLVPESIQPQALVDGPVTKIVPIRFEVSGSPESVYAIMEHFDTERPDMHMSTISLEYVGPRTVRLRTVLDWHTSNRAN